MAQNYFIQKKMALLKALSIKHQLNIQQVEKGLINSVDQLIQNQWNKINESVISNLNIPDTRSGKYTIQKNNWVNIPSNLVAQIKSGANNKNIFSLLGLYYEEWLEEQFSQTVAKTGNNAIDNVLNNFLQSFSQTGEKKSASSIRQYSNIRPDLATGIGQEDNQKVLRGEDGLAVELQIKFDIQSYREQNDLLNSKAIENDYNLLKEYIDSNMVGFSVKRWTDHEINRRKVLTSASGIQQIINQDFNFSQGKTWNALFAYRKMVWIISKYLLDILGPVNVAFITGVSFTWMSDFLADALLTMNIYSNKKCRNNEIFKPYINSGNIYVQHYKRSRKTALEQIKFSKNIYMSGKDKKGFWEAFQLNFGITKK